MEQRILLAKARHLNPTNYKEEIHKILKDCKDEVIKEKILQVKSYFENKK